MVSRSEELAILRVTIREMVFTRTEIQEGWCRKFTERIGFVNTAKVMQNTSYSRFHAPVPDKSVERRLILVNEDFNTSAGR